MSCKSTTSQNRLKSVKLTNLKPTVKRTIEIKSFALASNISLTFNKNWRIPKAAKIKKAIFLSSKINPRNAVEPEPQILWKPIPKCNQTISGIYMICTVVSAQEDLPLKSKETLSVRWRGATNRTGLRAPWISTSKLSIQTCTVNRCFQGIFRCKTSTQINSRIETEMTRFSNIRKRMNNQMKCQTKYQMRIQIRTRKEEMKMR